MKYENAKDVLPRELLEEVQKYASGKLLYFPITGQHSMWGAKNGSRCKTEQRNREIRQLFESGYSLDALSKKYYLAPESIKNIIYAKKGNQMNLDEILKLYSDETPLSTEQTFFLDEMKEWGEYYYCSDFIVTFPERKIKLRIHQYPFATAARIEEQNRTAETYRDAGCDVCRIVPSRSGALSCQVVYEGHECTVFAEECRENALPVSKDTPKNADGRFVCTDEFLTLMAKVGQLHTDGKEPNYAVLFDNSSACYKQYEDWIHEYTESDLPNRIREDQPDLLALYEQINAELRRTREELRPMYDKLPKSVFNGEEAGWPFLTDSAGHLVSLCDFEDGGADVCINHFLCVAMECDEILPDGYAWLAVHNPEINRMRIENLIHAMQVIGKEYTWTEEELTALPLVYKLMLFGRPYYYEMVLLDMEDHDKVKEMLEFILTQLTSPDEIDFRSILSKEK